MGFRGRITSVDYPAAVHRGLSRKLPVAALVAALLASIPAFAASKNESAALQRVDVQAQWAAELPQVLSADDIATYKRVFALQAEGNFPGVDREIAKLKDRRLVGHVLAERYLRASAWHTTYPELAAWLKEF